MTTVTAQEKHLTVNGVRLRYLDWGNSGKTPLVCLHGWSGQLHIWDEFAEAMCQHYHVITLDQRGHGDSQWGEKGYDRSEFMKDLEEFVDALGLSRFVLAGLSMGGWHCMLYGMDHPERVERILLVDIGPEPSPNWLDPRPPNPMVFPSLDAAVVWMRLGNRFATEARLRQDAVNKMRQQDDGQWTWKADPILFGPIPDMTEPERIARYWKAIESIQCPIMEVRGAESTLVDDEIVARMAKLGKQFSCVDIPGAGHIVTIDKPQEFIAATRDFLGVPA